MRARWFKRGDKWDKVVMSDEEESSLEKSFIGQYIEIFREIRTQVDSEDIDNNQKFSLSLEIFKKLASPGHFKLERVLEERRDEQMSKSGI